LGFRNALIDSGNWSLWVISDRVEPAAGLAMSALPRKRPTIVSGPHVAKCQKQTRALQAISSLLDRLMNTLLQRTR
jgi:hypothetical protein